MEREGERETERHYFCSKLIPTCYNVDVEDSDMVIDGNWLSHAAQKSPQLIYSTSIGDVQLNRNVIN